MKKYKKIIIVMVMILIVAGCVFGLPYLDRHYRVVNIKSNIIEDIEEININKKILTVYFTRLGNTDFEDGVDAVSIASLMKDKEQLIGNNEFIAKVIQKSINSDIYAIQTKKRYPSTYGDTVNEAGKEIRNNEYPELINRIDNFDEYEMIILIYPIWWGTFPNAVASFLKEYDFSQKTIVPICSHGGSGFSDSINDISKYCKADISESSLDLYCSDIDESSHIIVEFLKQLK